MSAAASSPAELFQKHEFAIRRIHSLLGIVPLGLFMTIHLTANASMANAPESFQRIVFLIHSPGRLLPLVEWAFIFAPLLFHAILGVWIAKNAKYNSGQYRYTANKRYTWQRVTGVIALVFLFVHVLHMHGWVHFEPWLSVLHSLNLAAFKPFNAASTLVLAMQGIVWPAFYLVGVLACVYHLANGIWTAGITWGLWISPTAQERAGKLCVVIGLALAFLGTTAWFAAVSPGPEDVAEMQQVEDRMYRSAVDGGLVTADPEKRSHPDSGNAEASLKK